jgi:hypothetical protein
MNKAEAAELVRMTPNLKKAVIGSDGSIHLHPDADKAVNSIRAAGNKVVYPESLCDTESEHKTAFEPVKADDEEETH